MNCVLNKNLTFRTVIMSSAILVSAFGANAADKPVTSSVVANTANVAKAAAPVAATTPAPPVVAMTELPDSATAAEVNGVKIPMKEINHAIDSIKKREPSLADGSAAATAELTKFRKGLLNDLIDFELLLQDAKERKITADPQKADAEVWQIKGKFPNPDAFAQFLKMTGQTEADLYKSTLDNLTVEELGNHLALDATVSDADLQKFYDDNKARFVIPEAVLVSHILIAVPQNSTDAEKKKLQDQAQKVLKEALKSGADFGELAKKYSDDKSSIDKGGSLGALVKVDKGSWQPVVDAAFAATPGKVIPKLITSDFGFHIILPIEKKPTQQLSLDDVRKDIKPMVLHQKVQAIIAAEIEKLRGTATIKTFI